MRILSALLFLSGSLAVTSSRAPPANKKFTQKHSEIIDAVARDEVNRPAEVASEMFKQGGLEGLAPCTIRRYLREARDRMAQGPAVGVEPTESDEDNSIQSAPGNEVAAGSVEYVTSEDDSLKSITAPHAVTRLIFTPAHEAIMREVFASNENVVESKKELFDIASIEFEKNQLNPVSFRTFGYNLDSAGLSCGYGRTFGRKEKARKSDKSKERFPEAMFQHRLLANAVRVGETSDMREEKISLTSSVGNKRGRESADIVGESKGTRKVGKKKSRSVPKRDDEEEEKFFAAIDAMLPSLWDY